MLGYYNEMSLEQLFLRFRDRLFLGSKLRPQISFRAFCYNIYEKK